MNERAAVKTRTANTPSSAASGLLRRECAACGNRTIANSECSECGKKKGMLQRKSLGSERTDGTDEVPLIVQEVLRSSGQPLDTATRAFMEPRFGHDFSRVRLHTDVKAAESAKAVDALAYTVGSDVVFGSGQYNPTTSSGRQLLAHELTHVLQNSSGALKASTTSLAIGEPGSSYEQEADTVAANVVSGKEISAFHPQGNYAVAGLQRQASSSPELSDGRPGCAVGSGITNSNCSAYVRNAWWLPSAYVNNATCACMETPNAPTANCVRKFLQNRLAATPGWLKALAVPQKENPVFVQTFLTPRIYQDHVDAYASCCCSAGPAPYPAWTGVTTVPLPCALVGESIRQFGSCHGTPGAW